MPFEYAPHAPLRIAVIGGGVAGLGAAYQLSASHQVTLFESEPRLGGHARTVLAGKNGTQPVDTGFIVFNQSNYPHLTQMFRDLKVPVAQSNMSFGVSADGGRVEYALRDLGALFAQRRNLVNPLFLGMLRDILRFNARAAQVATCPSLTLQDLMQELRLGAWFQRYYLLPFSGAIWSTPLHQMMEFPAQALVQFFINHRLMQVWGQHQWYTVDGGSIEYVRRLQTAIHARGAQLRLKAPVVAVRRGLDGVHIRTPGSEWEHFDRVVFACHSDQALAMLEQPTPQEKSLLGAIRYQPNRAVLHCDPKVMPTRKSCWASWVYSAPKGSDDQPVGVTYWMNSLQPIPKDDLLLGSLNPSVQIRDEMIYEETEFSHPVFDRAALEAQPKIRKLQGQNHTWFCGAWLRHGFHEDGYASAVDMANNLNQVTTWA